jgi:predicted GH43/DUF377 family glycosyl hydrolase
MGTKLSKNIVERWTHNPVLSIRDLPFQASDVHNAGIARHNGQYFMLVTVENLRGDCSIYRARGADGREFRIDEEPILQPSKAEPFATYEDRGLRDARITPFEDTYYIIYLAESAHGVRLGLAKTDDFQTIERIALISEPDTKSGVLFPARFDGRYARLERPREGGNIWISYSEDLIHWGDWRIVMTPRAGYWDYNRIGAAVPPLLTPCGWLLLYYGVRELPGGPVFRLGVAFLDPDDPVKVLGRSNIAVLAPMERYERIGDVANLVFSCGALLSEDGKRLELYYGAADSCICLGTMWMEELEMMCSKARAIGGF